MAGDGATRWVRWQRIGGGAGILAVFLLFGLVIWASAAASVAQPAADGPAADWLTFLRATAPSGAARAVAGQVAIFGLLTFLAALAVRLGSAGGIGVPSILILLTGGMAATLDASGIGLASYFRAQDLDAPAAGLLSAVLSGLSVGIGLAFAGTLVAAGVGALESAALPRALGWLGIIVGVAWLGAGLAPLSAIWNLPYLGFLVWVIGTSIVLLRSRQAP